MNAAFRRGDAITRLENYAPVLVERLALITWFPKNRAISHWKQELKAWEKMFQKYNTSNMKKGNYTKRLIKDALEFIIATDQDKDHVIIAVESHGVSVPDKADWPALKRAFIKFAESLLC